MFLVLGLGNPGARYVDTRHNVGFLVVDALARRAAVGVDREQAGALMARAPVSGRPCVLAKPQRFMNLSGGPGQALRDFFKVDLERVLVVHDDMDLPAGDVRVKVGGGHGGHNGLRDLVQHMGAGFVRVRMGVGRPPVGWDPADYVLGRWTEAETAGLYDFVARGADAVEAVVRDGVQRAMQALHTTEKAPTKGGASARGPSAPEVVPG
ncbi:MAG TPA: aminoacyl-tRNA hydrolase [Myxococcota bacterium]|nr:aminoacyl-tRNA hydrolase [Myxococcota bacterium]